MTDEQLMAYSLYERAYKELPAIISELGKHAIAKNLALWNVQTIFDLDVWDSDNEDILRLWERVKEEIKLIK